jgi:single-stranded-DNA-specific exonuclease
MSSELLLQWQIEPSPELPPSFVGFVGQYLSDSDGRYAARLLWCRGIRDLDNLPRFLDCDRYQPNSPFEFGQEMHLAVKRLLQAREKGQKVTIWGDFDADGITATSVLWEGLGQFFSPHLQLNYYIPNRQKESHGLNQAGIDNLAEAGTSLIVTCDTGSTNLEEIAYARSRNIDIIVTDHHTLPIDRPDVVAIVNPRYFAETHPLYHLSGVAVAYKLVEALYATLPDVPQQPLERLLDLVAVGLIADLVELKGDCRYLAQKGIRQLQKQSKAATATRTGVALLLELCRKSGDRPTDISYGIGPRINAVSRIHGDARFCVELLTSKDKTYCRKLAEETELANARRKELQKNTLEKVKKKLETIDLSTTSVIVLEDPQWEAGVLGLVAGQIAKEYARPTILLTSGTGEDKDTEGKKNIEVNKDNLARGSARSTNNIDLYELVKSQEHLLHRFGGHPLAAGLSLPTVNLAMFREAIDRQALQLFDNNIAELRPIVKADLTVTVAELGKELFAELNLLEPYGMGNPIPKLLIKNCWFTGICNKNIEDFKRQKVQYIKTNFKIWDRSSDDGFSGIWWGHNKDELPQNMLCDAIVELDFNSSQVKNGKKSYYGYEGYQVRLIAVRTVSSDPNENSSNSHAEIIDRRHVLLDRENLLGAISEYILLDKCPTCWNDLLKKYRHAVESKRNLILAYSLPKMRSPQEIWERSIGIAKYLGRLGKIIELSQLEVELGLSDRTLTIGLKLLEEIGFKYRIDNGKIEFELPDRDREISHCSIELFYATIAEEQFQRKYFDRVPLTIIQKNLRSVEPSIG